MEFDIDQVLEHHQLQVAMQDVYWDHDHPFSSIDPSTTSGKACVQVRIPVAVDVGAEHLFSDWPDFQVQCTMLENAPAQDESGSNCSLQVDSILNIADQCGREKAAPNSPHSVLEQQHLNAPSTTTGSKSNEGREDEAEMEDTSGLCNFIQESLDFSPMDCESGHPVVSGQDEEFIGCRLFHLLLAGAEAMFSQALDLAQVILLRLKELATCSSSTSSPIFQRITLYFTEGLQSLLDGARIARISSPDTSYLDTLTAFQALHEASPYIKFGHYIANQAILEAIGDDKRVHIIDYDIAEGIQWASFMQALASRQGGSPHLRITAVYRPHAKHQLSIFHETKASLIQCAAAFKVPLSFHQAKIDENDGRLVGLRLIKGETLVANCMLHLLHMPHKSPSSVISFLKAVNKLSPRLLTFVEEEIRTRKSIDSFFQTLHHYCAMLDSLEATLCETSQTATHMLVERAFLATRIKTALIASTLNSEGEEWSTVLQSAGFKQVAVSTTNVCQAKLLLGLFKDGYRLEEDRSNERLLLSWKFRPLMAASIWSCKNEEAGDQIKK